VSEKNQRKNQIILIFATIISRHQKISAKT